jgi:hypothetical protein
MMNSVLLVCVLVVYCFRLKASDFEFSLAGEWQFQLDRAGIGEKEGWFQRELLDRVHLPGGLTEQGIGDPPSIDTKWIGSIQNKNWYKQPELAEYAEPGNFKFPYWLTPERHYAGVAWYRREIEVPADWAGKRVVLSLERAHWETRVWVDNKLIGTNDSLGTPHEYDLGRLAPGKHFLTIRVDNGLIVDVGENSHSISDHTQGNWNGVVGKIELRATPLVWIEDLQVYPDPKRKLVRVRGELGNATGSKITNSVTLRFLDRSNIQHLLPTTNLAVVGSGEKSQFEAEVKWTHDPVDWDEFNPQLYELAAQVGNLPDTDTRNVQFGFREISTKGTQFLINGRKTFFRGTLECAIFPKTGHPPTDIDSWRRIIRIAKAHGLNMLRFHSWCPPEAAFLAADELGIYLQIEASSWANQSTTLGDSKPVDEWSYREADRILKTYGNHPSFILMLQGNEPGGKNHESYLSKWVTHYKAKDSRRLYSSGSGWPQIAENQFHITPDPRIQGWGMGLKSRINGKPPETYTDYRNYIHKRKVPVISHEIGQWCVYPNFDEIPKYTGYLKPLNFDIFRDSLRAHHLEGQAREFLLASGKLQTLCYKEDIEAALRTPGMGGFQLLDLHDFPGQGTALVGVLDPFWEEKGYVTPEEYSRFCNSTVPLARLSKRVFTTNERFEAEVEVAHFGSTPMKDAVIEWKLVGDAGKVFASGKLPTQTLPVGSGNDQRKVKFSLKNVPAPAHYKFDVGLANTKFENDWDIWVYPNKVATGVPAGITVASELEEALPALEAGGSVLLTIPSSRVARDKKLGTVGLGFSSIFWNTAWTGRQPPHTLGILCDPKDPLFAEFPTEYHSNWQWWYLVTRGAAMILDHLPAEMKPSVQVIDDWTTNRKLGLLFEACVGKGKLIVCSIDLENDLEADPVRRQFRHSVLCYMAGDKFNPKTTVTPEQVQNLFAPLSPELRGVSLVSADSEEPANDAGNAIDGDPDTFWHTAWRGESPGYPHELRIEFKMPITLRGFTALPRQDGRRNGWIKDYRFYVSTDGKNWSEPTARGSFSEDKELKTVMFNSTAGVRFVRFVPLSSFDKLPYASLAEFSVLETGK